MYALKLYYLCVFWKYNLKENQYSGIIYKNNKEYLRFNDIINNNSDSNYDLIRCIGKNKVYIKNGEIQSIDNTILSKKLIKIKRDLIRDVKYLTFDIECYLNWNNKFKPFACKWYHPRLSKEFLITDYLNWEDMLDHHYYVSNNMDIPIEIWLLHQITHNSLIYNFILNS